MTSRSRWYQRTALLMAAPPAIIENEWAEGGCSLPGENDFDPWGGCLDAQCAWRDFGGLSRQKAFDRFLENPVYYQEDFMFMGGVAFAYYYPVIERFLLETVTVDEPDDREAWILAHGIMMQLQTSRDQIRHLQPRFLELSNFVRNNLQLFTADSDERDRIDQAWSQLESIIEGWQVRP